MYAVYNIMCNFHIQLLLQVWNIMTSLLVYDQLLQVWDIMTSLLVYDQLLPNIYKYTLVFHVTWSLVWCVCLVDHCLSFCTFSFGHCLVCSSLIYRFWLPPFGIFKLFFYHQDQFTTYVYSLSLRFLCCVYVFYAYKS